MSMNLTEENKAEIREIAREVLKEYALNAEKDSEKLTQRIDKLSDTLTSSIEKMGAIITAQVQKDLRAIELNFENRITLMIQERKNDIETVNNNMELCKTKCNAEFEKIGYKLITTKDIWIVLGKAGAIFSGSVALISLVVYAIIKA